MNNKGGAKHNVKRILIRAHAKKPHLTDIAGGVTFLENSWNRNRKRFL
ncbi:MAG: hypothetical protein Q7R94_01235 [bacterium]|nr:hypothetical protein [bacterium]